METIIKTYRNDRFDKYATERAELIKDGYRVIDENLIRDTNFSRGGDNGSPITYVTGCVVFTNIMPV